MLKWIKDHYGCEVVACCVDVGQAEDYGKLKNGPSPREQAAPTSWTPARNSRGITVSGP